MKRFEVGMVYQHKETKRLFLATSHAALLTFIAAKAHSLQPYFLDRFTLRPHVTVQELTDHWQVSVERLDEVMLAQLKRDFKPSQVVPNTKKRSVAQEMALGDELRAVRCATAL